MICPPSGSDGAVAGLYGASGIDWGGRGRDVEDFLMMMLTMMMLTMMMMMMTTTTTTTTTTTMTMMMMMITMTMLTKYLMD